MDIEEIKNNKIYMIVALLIVICFAYTTYNGIAYWPSGGVENNRNYHYIPGVHHVYGTGFYHK